MPIGFSELKSLDYPFRAEPFCNISARQSISTITLDSVYQAEPFVTKSIETLVAAPAIINCSASVLNILNLSGYILSNPAVINLEFIYAYLLIKTIEATSNINIVAIADNSNNIIANAKAEIRSTGYQNFIGFANSFTLSIQPAIIQTISIAEPLEPRLLYSRNAIIRASASASRILNTRFTRIKSAVATINASARINKLNRGIGNHPAVINTISTYRTINIIDQFVASTPAEINITTQTQTIAQIINNPIATISTQVSCVGSIHTSKFIAEINLSASISSSKVYRDLAGDNLLETEDTFGLEYVHHGEPFVESCTWYDNICHGSNTYGTIFGGSLDIAFRAEPFVFMTTNTHPTTIKGSTVQPMIRVYDRYHYPGYKDIDGTIYKTPSI